MQNQQELIGASPDGPHQRRIDARQRLPAFQRLPSHRDEVHDFVDRETEDLFPSPNLEEHGGPRHPPCSVGGGIWLPQRPPSLHQRDEGAPYVDDPRHDRRRPRNPGGLEPRQDLADPLRLGGAEETAHPEQQQSDDSRVTHPKRRSQDTARGCVEQANSDRRPLLEAPERDRRARPSGGRGARPPPDAPRRASPRGAAGGARGAPGARPPGAWGAGSARYPPKRELRPPAPEV